MNTEQLNGMTDGELSMAILEVKTDKRGMDYRLSPVNSQARCSVGTNGCGVMRVVFDINNPADMWPLIDEGNISLTKAEGDNPGNDWSADIVHKWEDTQDQHGAATITLYHNEGVSTMHKKPLRAAAIVWLLMRGGA